MGRLTTPLAEPWNGSAQYSPNRTFREGSARYVFLMQVIVRSRVAMELAEPGVTGMDNGQETTLLPFPGILGGSLTLCTSS